MAEDKDRFTKEETFVLGNKPYFPAEKVKELIGVDWDHLTEIMSVRYIAKHTIEVCLKAKSEYETYIDPEGCLLLAMISDTKMVGKELKISIATIMQYILTDKTEEIPEYCKSPEAHRFVKALYDWAESEKIEGFWGNMPVQ